MSSLEQDIEATRDHLGDTVNALATKAAVGRRRLGIFAAAGIAAVIGIMLWRRLG